MTTGRTWSQPPAGPCVPPCLPLMAGVLPRATLTSCSRQRPPLRTNSKSCSTGQRPTESVCLLQTWQQSWWWRNLTACVHSVNGASANKHVRVRILTWDERCPLPLLIVSQVRSRPVLRSGPFSFPWLRTSLCNKIRSNQNKMWIGYLTVMVFHDVDGWVRAGGVGGGGGGGWWPCLPCTHSFNAMRIKWKKKRKQILKCLNSHRHVNSTSKGNI